MSLPLSVSGGSISTLHSTRGGAVVACRAHNPEVVGSSPAPATKKLYEAHRNVGFFFFLQYTVGMKKIEHFIESLIFWSRWLQVVLYLGLIVASVLYSYKFLVELLHLIQHVGMLSESAVMMAVLTLVDFTMVANLLFMVIVGGYSTFVSKLNTLKEHEDRPEWLDKVSAGTLKVKLAGSLVGVSGIHLLQTFITLPNHTREDVIFQIVIHLVFLASTVLLAYSEKILHN